jgi:hypothetical protein
MIDWDCAETLGIAGRGQTTNLCIHSARRNKFYFGTAQTAGNIDEEFRI